LGDAGAPLIRRYMAALTKRTWTLLGILLALVLVVVLLRATRDRPPEVQVVHVLHDNLVATISSNGKIEPIQPYIFRAEFPTFVSQLSAKEGQSVTAGQKILRLDDTDAASQLDAARTDLLTAQNLLNYARSGGSPDQITQLQGELHTAQLKVQALEKTQRSLQDLFAKQAATQAEIDQNNVDLAGARANLQTLEQRKAELDHTSSLDVQRLTLRVQQDSDNIHSLEGKVRSANIVSPIDGTLYSLTVHAGDYVVVGQDLAEIADLRHVQLRVFVDEPDLGGLEPGQEVRITWDALPNREWIGHTVEIPKQVVARGTRSVGEVLCSVANDKLELLPNINVSVLILLRSRTNVLSVSRAAIVANGGHRYAFLVVGNHLQVKEVKVGIASPTKYEILSGLSDGDAVAVSGDVPLHDGMAVQPVEAE
jgi:HlyD family secretion protein